MKTSENIDQVVSEFLKVAKPAIEIRSSSNAKEATAGFLDYGDDSYLMLSPKPGNYLIWESRRDFPRQMIRRTAAKVLGIEEFYNWRQYPFAENMYNTVLKLKKC